MQKTRRIVRAYDDSETTVKEVLNNFILGKQADDTELYFKSMKTGVNGNYCTDEIIVISARWL